VRERINLAKKGKNRKFAWRSGQGSWYGYRDLVYERSINKAFYRDTPGLPVFKIKVTGRHHVRIRFLISIPRSECHR
jgi:hypothetical protein